MTHGNVKLVIEVPDEFAWAKSLLDWVAWDIHEGYLGVGHGTTRGMGWLELTKADEVRGRLCNLTEVLAGKGAPG